MAEILVRAKFAAPLDEAAVAADWRARGYSCGTFVDPPGRCWEGPAHHRARARIQLCFQRIGDNPGNRGESRHRPSIRGHTGA